MSAKKSTNTAEETALEQWAASDEPTVRDDAIVTGPTEEARDAMHQILMGAAFPEQKEDIERAAKGGRPRLSPGEGRSPLWRVRVPEPLDKDLHAAAEAEGRNFSDVLRDAAEEYLDHHHRAPVRTRLGIVAGAIGAGAKKIANRRVKGARYIAVPRAEIATHVQTLRIMANEAPALKSGKVAARAATQREALHSVQRMGEAEARERMASAETRTAKILKGHTTDA